MMFFCPFCGARRFTCWPLFWPWQYKGELYCSYNCWICDSTRQERERKGYKMARMRKDGTPAKKPGPKAKKELNIGKDEVKATPPTVKLDGAIRIETPEAHNVDIVETPEEPKQVIELHGIDTDIVAMNKQCNFDDRCTVSAIRVKDLGEFYYDKKFTSIDWRTPAGDEVSLGPAWWVQLSEDLPFILKKLGVNV